VLSFAVPFNRLKQAIVQKCWAKTNLFADGAKPACLDFCSSKFNLQGHILSTGEEREWNGYAR
jgi:Fe-S-cluster-containing dehydrogenase component